MVGTWFLPSIIGARTSFWDLPLLWATLPLVVALLIAAVVIAYARRQYQDSEPAALSSSEQLAHYRKLYEAGEIDKEEYARLKALLSGRMRHELGVPAPPADRQDAAQEQHGLGYCNITKCCTEVCPEHIKITDNALIPMKERVVDRKYDPLVWLGNKIGIRNKDNDGRTEV